MLYDPNRVVLRVIDFFHLTMGLYMLGCFMFSRLLRVHPSGGEKSQRKFLLAT